MRRSGALLILGPLVLASTLVNGLQAQPQAVRFERITVADGLSNANVTSIMQDPQGFMWFGTHDGLNKYDGYDFAVYRNDPDDTTSLSHDHIEALLLDRTGTLWIGTQQGLNRFDPATDTFVRFGHDSGDGRSLSHESITALYEDRQGVLWVGMANGLNRFDSVTASFTRYLHDLHDFTTLSHGQVAAIYEDAEGALWVGTESGLNLFEEERGAFLDFRHDPDDPNTLIDNRVGAIYEDSEGALWVGTCGSGLHRYDRQRRTFHRVAPDDSDQDSIYPPSVERGMYGTCPMVNIIHEDKAGALWIGTFGGGLNRHDRNTGKTTRYTHNPANPNSLSGDAVASFFEDPQGRIWIGTQHAGLNKLDPSRARFRHWAHEPGNPNSLNDREVRAIHEDREGRLWIGTLRGGLNQYDPATGTFTYFRHEPGNPRSLGEDWVFSIHEDSAGTFWVGTSKGLSQLDPAMNTFRHYLYDHDDPNLYADHAVFEIYEDQAGMLWIGTNLSGLYRLNPETGALVHFEHDPAVPTSLSHEQVTTMLEDRAGVLWFGTGDGLARYDVRSQTFHTYLEGLAVTAIAEDQAGVFWLGTWAQGLHRFDPASGTSRSFTVKDGLPSNAIADILIDETGDLWIATLSQLARFDPQTETFRNYNVGGGIEHNGFVWFSGHTSPRGEMFFGSYSGFISFFPNEVEDNPYPPEVVLTEIRIFDEPIASPMTLREEIRLPHHQNDLTFQFVGLHYTDPVRNRYRYRLENYDSDWVNVGTERTARYPRLPPGEYVFRVRAANSDGVWNDGGASLYLTILPPWWRTTWAYVFYGLLFLAGVFAVDRMQRRRLIARERKRAEIREAEIRAETAELQAHLAEEHAQKLEALDEAKSRFFANVSHEFRTPLTLLLGPIQDVLSGRTDGLSRSQLVAMHRNARRLLGLVGQLLDLARIESGLMRLNRQPVDLVALLKEGTTAFTARAEREHVTLSFHARAERLPALVDPDKLEKVIFNLLANAFKFTPSGGKVRIHLRRVEEPSGAHAEITVKDTGQGILPEKLPYIFDRFFQVGDASTQKQAGTGIGLALAKEFVELHGGRIEAESDPGFGTTFTVRLPIEEDLPSAEGAATKPNGKPLEEVVPAAEWGVEDDDRAVENAAEQVDRAGQGAPTGACVLVVEDSADVRTYVRGLLTPDYRVLEACDGEEGLEAVRAHRPDLVIVDVMMPRLDGFDLCRILKEDVELNHIPVVLLTAKADQESRLEGLGAGADVYLAKPFDAEELLLHVENLIELRRQLRARYADKVLISPAEIEVSSQEAAFLERVREVVEAHLGDADFGVERLADELNLSTRQLQRRLRETAGLSAAAFIRKMRLARAAQLLEQESAPVSQIAYQVGYRNADAFSRVFRQVFGVPPSEYPD